MHIIFKSHHKTRSKRILESLTIQKLASEEANRVIEKSKSKQLRLKELVSTTNRNKVSDYRLYAPLYSGFRVVSRLALLQTILLIVRRMLLLYVAMFLPGKLSYQL